jgi:protein gp37
MGIASAHTYQILTKRPERMREFLADRRWRNLGHQPAMGGDHYAPIVPGRQREGDVVLPNVWLGVSIENRRFVHRADLLRETPAAVRFISAEPLLGPLVHEAVVDDEDPVELLWGWSDGYDGPQLDLDGIDWLIVGGESGARHRPIHKSWVRDLRDAAHASGTAFFFKQWGGRTPKAGGRELDGRIWDEFPMMSTAVGA